MSLYQSTRYIVKEEGILNLWRGLTPAVLRIAPGLSLYFSLIQNFIVGLSCRSMTATILHPTTLIKTKLESSYYRGHTMTMIVRKVVNERGILGLWNGLIPTLLRDAPFSGLYLMFYRRQLALLEEGNIEVIPVLRFLAGILAGFMACLITQPFDVLKTSAQLYPKEYKSMRFSIHRMYTQLGTRSFFIGFIPRVLRRTLTAALNWTVFDELQKRISS